MGFSFALLLAGLVAAPLVAQLVRREGGHATAVSWALAWVALYCTGILLNLASAHVAFLALGNVTGPLFAGLLLAGCRSFIGLPNPRWLGAAVAGACAVGAASAWLGRPGATLVSSLTEIPFVAAAVLLMGTRAWRSGSQSAERPLTAALSLLLLLEVVEWVPLRWPETLLTYELLWIAAALITGFVQLLAFSERNRARSEHLTEERELLRRVARTGVAAADPRQALAEVGRELRYRGLFSGFAIWSACGDGRGLELLAGHSARVASFSRPRLSLAHPLLRAVQEGREPVVVEEVAKDERLPRDVRNSGVGRLVLAPLRAGGEFLGVIAVEFEPRSPFDPAARGFIADLADEIAMVLAAIRFRERERAQMEALAAEQGRLRTLVEAAPAGITFLDRKGRILVMNRQAADQLGLEDEASWVQQSACAMADAIRGELDPEGIEALETFRQTLLQGQPQHPADFALRIRGERLVQVTTSRVEGGGGWICVSRDITAEQEAAEHAQRSQRLQMLGTLAGGVAHDFNNRLTAILGNASRLLEEVQRSEQREAIQDIVDAAQRCAEITAGLVAFARHEPASPRPTDVRSALEQVEGLLRPSLPAGVSLQIECGELGSVLADAGALHRVLMNVLVNARDAVGRRGSIRLEAQLLPAAEGDCVSIQISDDGPGMDEETRQRIFDPFFTTKIRADGMGLAIAHSIVEAHGGSLWVQSEPGKGSCFRVLWPAAQRPLAANAAPRNGPGAPAEGQAPCLLVAEDEPAVRRLATRALERAGYQVIAVEDGFQALEAFRAHRGRIAAAVLDLQMPRLTGLEALARIREESAELPVLLMSGHPERESRGSWPEGQKLLAKPFGMGQLVQCVGELLGPGAAPAVEAGGRLV